jgi:hypothetical protein
MGKKGKDGCCHKFAKKGKACKDCPLFGKKKDKKKDK